MEELGISNTGLAIGYIYLRGKLNLILASMARLMDLMNGACGNFVSSTRVLMRSTRSSLSQFSLNMPLKKKQLVVSAHNLYYVADSIKLLGDKVANILKEGCALPHKTRDSVLTLASQCFESADLMLRHYEEINQLLEKEKNLSNADGIKFRVYLLSWLGYLHTTADGFKSLNMRLLLQKKRPADFLELVAKCNELGKLVKRHANELRELRNNIFHLRTDDKAISQFFSEEGKRIEWARALHAAFSSFFSDYRVIAEVHYLCSGRLGESQIRQESMNRRKKYKISSKLKNFHNSAGNIYFAQYFHTILQGNDTGKSIQ